VVCGAGDARALVEVGLDDGARATLCGTHALVWARQPVPVRSVSELRAQLAERRRPRDRRTPGDELGEALQAAFRGERRDAERRAG
jgi:hypothetical protein